ncbi:hypothetical protein J5N97_017326 [Dioscorea zingiberensis]|uniref:NAC domain-containing protein n=1 Tax=Dioscorea zingiberensis TaxID=325984 RepID=A0A9D5HG14_9LILI|nr:hypothetical protein J5N97_017326 [Dioscorea zingiberensis]
MHEYRLAATNSVSTTSTRSSKVLDEWVLCRIYQKKHHERDRINIGGVMAAKDTNEYCSPSEETSLVTATAAAASDLCEFEEKVHVFPRSCSLAHLLEPADYLSASLLFDDYSTFFNSIEELFENKVGNSTAATFFTYPINPC